jgi:hypothetical protein
MSVAARRALFTVLILLTAFRGMVGDAMAYGMTGQMMNPQITMNIIAFSADSMPANGHLEHQKVATMPCHESMAAQDVPVSTEKSETVCSTCQVCHLSVTLPFSIVSHSPSVHHADKPSLSVSAWVSADLALLSKPPLS